MLERWDVKDAQALQLRFVEPAAYVLERGGRQVCRFPGTAPVLVEFASETLEVRSFGRGWRLAFVPCEGESPRAWYDGHTLLRDARIVVAPDREYALRSPRTTARRWELTEEGVSIATLRVAKGDWSGDIRVEAGVPPATPDDAPLLVAIACLVIIYRMMEPDRAGLDLSTSPAPSP